MAYYPPVTSSFHVTPMTADERAVSQLRGFVREQEAVLARDNKEKNEEYKFKSKTRKALEERLKSLKSDLAFYEERVKSHKRQNSHRRGGRRTRRHRKSSKRTRRHRRN